MQDCWCLYVFCQAEDGIRDRNVTGVQTCALPISSPSRDCGGPVGPRAMAVTVRADPQAPRSPYWDLWISILPLRRVPPSGGPASTVMVNVSLVPGSPLSVTLTVKVHGASFLMQVPPNMAVLPSITSVVRVTLWTFAPRALLTYWRSPPTGPVVVCACTT